MEGNYHFLDIQAVPPRVLRPVGGPATRTGSTPEPSGRSTPCRRKSTQHFWLSFAPRSPMMSTYALPFAVRHGSGGKIAKSKLSTHREASTDVLFSVGNCGTFMPLSRVRGGSRIAVVWTCSRAAVSAISSGHFSVLFTHGVVRLAVDCQQ